MRFKHGVMVVLALILLAGGLPAVRAQGNSPLDGLWLTDGYGMAFEAVDGTVTLYEITRVSCLPLVQVPYDGETIPDLGVTASREGDRLTIRDALTMHMTAHSIETLPAACANGGTSPSADPVLNFEVFWHTFDEQYAFFDLYGVDWQAQYETYRPQVTAETTDAELFAILSEMITPLQDGHISLVAEDEVFSPGTYPAWLDSNMQAVIDRLREAYVGGEGVTALANGLLTYRSLDDTTGAIFITEMAGFSSDGTNEVEAAGAAIDEAIAALAGKQRIIVDVRFNGGGLDAVALALAGRFADQERLAFTKQARDGDDFTPLREFVVRPEGPAQFTGPVIVLTSGVTASAAEIFVMAMQALPNTLVIGEPTSGGHSDILGRRLPNGWQFGLSNEVYYASDGECYEAIGLPPEAPVAFDAAAFIAGTDTMLEAALATE